MYRLFSRAFARTFVCSCFVVAPACQLWRSSASAADPLVRYEGGGHGIVTSADPCIDDVSLAYLLDLRLPVEGKTCPARIDAL